MARILTTFSREKEYEPLRGIKQSPRCAASLGTQEDVVQFIESVAVVNSKDGKLDVGIMRIGRNQGSCKCAWKTMEGSAKPGKQYETSSGIITMEDGESSSEISVPILCDPNWNATKEFRIVLESPENCTLGLYLKVLRVKIIDANVFPSNDFRSQVPPECAEMDEDISELGLFLGFIRLMWYQDGVQWRTILQLIFGLLHNLYDYMALIVSVYLVDKVFNFDYDDQALYIPGNRLLTAYAIALALFLPRVLFFGLKHAENYMDLNGKMRTTMSQSLFRKFMNYSSRSREDIPLPDMVNSLIQDVNSVSRGYSRTLHMCRTSGSIVIAIFFTLQSNPSVWWAVVAVPCIMGLWIKVRTRIFIEASEASDDKESALLAFSNMSLSKMTLIAAYRQRPQMNEYFEEKVQNLQTQAVASKTVEVNNEGVPTLLGPTMVAVYTLFGASLVLNHELGLGTYLATIKVFGEICDNFSELYNSMMGIIRTFPVLKGLTQLLNMETELPSMMAAAKKTAETTMAKRKEMAEGDVPRCDRMEIEICNISFAYTDAGGKPIQTIFENFSAKAEQGQLVALKAKSGAGRKTFLDLLAGTIYPTSGSIFIPSHLRVLLVSREVFLLDLSIWANLTFGNKAGNNPRRVEALLKYFRMNAVLEDKHFQKDLQKRKEEFDGSADSAAPEEEEEEDIDTKNPMLKFRESEQACIHVVRGFIANPEVMLIHRPFMHFHDEDMIKPLERALQGHTTNRGFEMPAESLLTRRPRTIIMSCDNERHEGIADLILEIPSVHGQRVKVRKQTDNRLPLPSKSDIANHAGAQPSQESQESERLRPAPHLIDWVGDSGKAPPTTAERLPLLSPERSHLSTATSNGPNRWDI